MANNLTIGGVTFLDSEFLDRGYLDDVVVNGVTYQRFIALFAAGLVDLGRAMTTTSSTISINVISTSTHTITLDADRPFTIGSFVMVADVSVVTRFMFAQVNDYVSSTKVLTVSTVLPNGTGTITNANISIAGVRGAAGSGAPSPTGAGGQFVVADGGGTSLVMASAQEVAVLSQGKFTMGIGAGNIIAAASAGCGSLSKKQTGTNKSDAIFVPFDPATREYGIVELFPPKQVDVGATLIIREMTWQHASTAASAGVAGIAYSFRAKAAGQDDVEDVAWGASVVITDTGISAETTKIAPDSGALTVGATWAAGDKLVLKVGREVANSNDTLSSDAQLEGFRVVFTTDKVNDT